MKNELKLFEDSQIRTAWDNEKEEWYFSIVDVVAVLTEQKTTRGASTYWSVLKKRMKEEGADELLTNCKQLKMTASDGKKGLLMLLIQSKFSVLFSLFRHQKPNRLRYGSQKSVRTGLMKLLTLKKLFSEPMIHIEKKVIQKNGLVSA